MATKSSNDKEVRRIFETILSKLSTLSGQDEERFSLQIDGLCTRGAYGYTYTDKDSPGTLKFRGQDESGRRLEGSAAYVDSQSGSPRAPVEAIADEHDVLAPIDIASDSLSPVQFRVEAIRQWLAESPADASKFILDTLTSSDIEPNFRDALVFLSEDARYEQSTDRNALASILKQIAGTNIHSHRSNAELVVWAAIRRFASLVSFERIDELRPFLTNTGGVDTRLVTLQGVLNAFELQPAPSTLLPALRERIYQMAIKLIDADVLMPGDNSAIVELSLCSLLALGDSRFEDCVRQVSALNWPWLTTQLLNSLRELRENWKQSVQDEVVRNAIRRATAVVDSN